MNILIFTIGFVIFATYMFFLVRMINTQHKKQELEQGPIIKSPSKSKKFRIDNKVQYIKSHGGKKIHTVKRK